MTAFPEGHSGWRLAVKRSKPTITAEEWVALLPPIPHADMRNVLDAASLGNRPRRRGIPVAMPRGIASRNGLENLNERLAAAERAYRAGYSEALLVAISDCLIWSRDLPLPSWIAQAIVGALQRRSDGVASSLDEALGLLKPPKKKSPRYFEGMIVIEINQAHSAGLPKDNELFEAFGNRWGVKRSTIKDLYYSVMPKKGPKISAI